MSLMQSDHRAKFENLVNTGNSLSVSKPFLCPDLPCVVAAMLTSKVHTTWHPSYSTVFRCDPEGSSVGYQRRKEESVRYGVLLTSPGKSRTKAPLSCDSSSS